MGLWYSISGILLLLLLVPDRGRRNGSVFFLWYLHPLCGRSPLHRRIHLPRLEMGKFACAVSYSHGLRSAEITSLDQGQSILTALIPQEGWWRGWLLRSFFSVPCSRTKRLSFKGPKGFYSGPAPFSGWGPWPSTGLFSSSF